MEAMELPDYPCPVCGYLVFDEPPGSFAICPFCFWEDDIVQLAYPLMAGGANKVSLYEAQQEFIKNGASEYRFIRHVRKPTTSDRREPRWRPFIPSSDSHLSWNLEEDHQRWQSVGPNVCLYYWRDDYWLSPKNYTGTSPS